MDKPWGKKPSKFWNGKEIYSIQYYGFDIIFEKVFTLIFICNK